MLLKYKDQVDISRKINLKDKFIQNMTHDKSIHVGFIGAGAFAQKYLLPQLKNKLISLKGIAALEGSSSRHLAEKYGFEFATTDWREIIENDSINTVFIATRHDTHYELVKNCILKNKTVYVEKPLTRTPAELKDLFTTYQQLTDKKKFMKTIMVGYNRRFAPHIKEIKKRLIADFPVVINYRVNAGPIPSDHWVQDKEVGGGRIVGEVCHFVDLMMFLACSNPNTVTASAIPDSSNLKDNLQILLNFENGSIGTLTYISNGNRQISKERIEIHQTGISFIIDDFKVLHIYGNKYKKYKLFSWDKGHRNEISEFINSLFNGNNTLIRPDELFLSSLTTFKILESIEKRCTVAVNLSELSE
jgi:polar amino acid transport system substrate-binding protein